MKPSIGRIVIYRSRAGVDMPAIVTAVDSDDQVHLHLFPPPGQSADTLSHQWGVRREDDPETPDRWMTWRWPERVE